MNNKENINNFVNKFIDDNNTDAIDLSTYIKNKAKEIVASYRDEVVNESLGNSAIKFHGDEILVNGKIVGSVKNDSEDNSGIKFVPADGGKLKEFEDIEALYGYLANEYKITENGMTDGLGTVIDDPKKLDLDDKLNILDLKNVTDGGLPKPGDTSSNGSSTPRTNKIKGLINKISNSGRATSTKETK